MQQNGKLIGVVKWFSEEKGYGFIAPEGGGKDYFVHHKDILMEGFKVLREGQKVTFVAKDGAKGPQAVEVEATA